MLEDLTRRGVASGILPPRASSVEGEKKSSSGGVSENGGDERNKEYSIFYLNSDPLRRNVHLSSDRGRSIVSKWHEMWWNVKVSFADWPRPDRSKNVPDSEPHIAGGLVGGRESTLRTAREGWKSSHG